MKSFFVRGLSAAGLCIAIATTALLVVDACGGSTDSGSSSGGTGTAADGGGGTSTVSTSPGACTTSTVDITFSPMYSAFIPGSTAHTFQIPAVTTDGSSATWSLSDPSQAQLAAQDFDGLPGVMITLQGVGANGTVNVIATKSDGSCGLAALDITSTTEDDWQIGNSRYNDGIALHLGPPDGGGGMGGMNDGGRPEGGMGPRTSDGGSFFEVDGGTACTNCHGPTATTGPFKDVSHTPEQTGGFSDDQLIAIITTGTIPDGGYFDPTVIDSTCEGGTDCTERAYREWSAFHRWTDIESDQYKGIITYLRSLQPASQNGASNFGGRTRPDGGMRPPGGG